MLEDSLSADVLWTARVRRELHHRAFNRVFLLESTGPNNALHDVEAPHTDVDDNGDVIAQSASWGQEEAGFAYDCLAGEVRLSGGHYLRYYQDAANAVCHDAQSIRNGMIGICEAQTVAINSSLAGYDTPALEAALRRSVVVLRSMTQVVQRHAVIADAMAGDVAVLAFLRVGVAAAQAVAKQPTRPGVVQSGVALVQSCLRHVSSLPHTGTVLACLSNVSGVCV